MTLGAEVVPPGWALCFLRRFLPILVWIHSFQSWFCRIVRSAWFRFPSSRGCLWRSLFEWFRFSAEEFLVSEYCELILRHVEVFVASCLGIFFLISESATKDEVLACISQSLTVKPLTQALTFCHFLQCLSRVQHRCLRTAQWFSATAFILNPNLPLRHFGGHQSLNVSCFHTVFRGISGIWRYPHF